MPWVDHGEIRVELLRRGGRLAIRVRAATSPDRDRFTHVPTFTYDPARRLTGRFTPNGDLTEQWRQLHFSPPAPDGDGEVLLDFNQTLNMWFAFTDYATCPAPIEGNVITITILVPVPAGEQRVERAGAVSPIA